MAAAGMAGMEARRSAAEAKAKGGAVGRGETDGSAGLGAEEERGGGAEEGGRELMEEGKAKAGREPKDVEALDKGGHVEAGGERRRGEERGAVTATCAEEGTEAGAGAGTETRTLRC